MESSLKLSHPFAPFVTETIWQTLKWTDDTLLINQLWPDTQKYDEKSASEFAEIQAIVAETRMITSSLKIKKTSLYFSGVPFLRDHSELIAGLANLEAVKEVEDGKGLHLTTTSYNCWLAIDRETTENYVIKLKMQLQEAENTRESLQKRLKNEAYVKQAPKELVQDTKDQVTAADQLIYNIKEEVTRFSSTS